MHTTGRCNHSPGEPVFYNARLNILRYGMLCLLICLITVLKLSRIKVRSSYGILPLHSGLQSSRMKCISFRSCFITLFSFNFPEY